MLKTCLAAALAFFLTLPTQAQTAVAVGSYASAVPAGKNITTDSNPLYVLPGAPAAIPTND